MWKLRCSSHGAVFLNRRSGRVSEWCLEAIEWCLELSNRAQTVSADFGSLKCTQIVNISMGNESACLELYFLCQPVGCVRKWRHFWAFSWKSWLKNLKVEFLINIQWGTYRTFQKALRWPAPPSDTTHTPRPFRGIQLTFSFSSVEFGVNVDSTT